MAKQTAKGSSQGLFVLEVYLFHDTGRNITQGEDLRKGESVHLKQELNVILHVLSVVQQRIEDRFRRLVFSPMVSCFVQLYGIA